MSKLLLVAIVIVALALPIAASAQEVAPLWHCDAVSTPVAGNPGWNYTASGSASYWRTKQVGGTVVVQAQPSPVFTHAPIVEGVQYQVQAADNQGGPWSNDASCVFSIPPLAVVIEAFTVACSGAPYGSEAAINFSVSTELFSTNYIVARDGDVVLSIPAACPGCAAGMSYERNVSLPDTHGVYTLMVYNGSELVDIDEFFLASCAVPTAVKLAALKAQTEPVPPNDLFGLADILTLSGAALATWFFTNMIVKAKESWQAKIVAIPVAFFVTLGATLIANYPGITAEVVFLGLVNSAFVYAAATGGATMLAARAAAPKRAMAGGKIPFNKAWW